MGNRMWRDQFNISPEVRDALENSTPVVALESTIISHGMPYPDNVKVALDVERTIRANGAVPATIAVIGGRPTVGLSPKDIEHIGEKGSQVMKVSRRDLPYAIGKRLDGATTVSATMICAASAGIDVFVTGGIGGVHRDVQTSMDVSADLREFSRSPVLVVSAGVKSILDIALTAEYLETEGICVIGFGTDHFPAFYTRESHVPVHVRIDSAEEIASVFIAQKSLFPSQGILVTNPIPDSAQIPVSIIDGYIQSALADCSLQKISGKAVTPFLLKRIVELSGGKSLEANIALVMNNAVLGAVIAAEIVRLREGKDD